MQLLLTIISNKMDPSLVTVFFHWDERINQNTNGAYYDGRRIRMTMMDCNATYLELVRVCNTVTEWNPNHCGVFLLYRFSMHTVG